MAHASLPPKFWIATFITSILLINRLPTPILHVKSPYEIVFHSPPSYTTLRVFRCACYPYLTPFGCSKLNFKSTHCIFLGYSPHHKGYCYMNINSGRIYVSRHVLFDEINFPYSTPKVNPELSFQSFKVWPLPTSIQTVSLQPMGSATPSSSNMDHQASI